MLYVNQPLPTHLCQSPLWQKFRKEMGYEVHKVGSLYLTIHPTPLGKVGYCPKPQLAQLDWESFAAFGRQQNCLHIKVDSPQTENEKSLEEAAKRYPLKLTQPIFAQETIFLDLTQSEEKLLEKMDSKTRYNVRLAQKKGVVITEKVDEASLKAFLTLQKETAKRQRFYLHPDCYYQKAWQILHPANMAHLLLATTQGQTAAAWMLFNYAGVLYYLYGGSDDSYRSLMPNNLMMWEAIKLGKRLGCQLFDLGGINTEPEHPWAGLTRFKMGFGGQLVKFPPSYDLVIRPAPYRMFRIADRLRWSWLDFKRRF